MFCNLVNIIVVNAYLLFMHLRAANDQKFTDHEHHQFRKALYMGFFSHSTRVNEPIPNIKPETEHCKIRCKQASCVVCKKKMQEQQGKKRTALKELLSNQNTDSRSPKRMTRV